VRSHFDFIAFIRDKQGIFWFGQQDGGLYRIDPESRDWNHYNYDKGNPEGLPDQHVRSMLCDSRGTIWVSTWNGLSKIIPQADKDTILTFDNHFIHNPGLDHTLKITEDIQGNILVGTLSGLMVIRPDGTIDKYTHKDNLPSDPSAVWLLEKDHENGAIYLGRSDIAKFPSGFLASEQSIAPTLLTEFSIGGEKVNPGEDSPLKSSILTTDHIHLRHDQNFFRIKFATPYFSHPERNRYRYILEGIDPDTVYSGNQSYAEYTNLGPGNYTFWVTGAIHRGPWDPLGTSIEISIAPPWYRSQAAQSGYFIALVLFVFGFVRLRTEKLRKEKIILERQVNERTVEIRQKNEKIVEMERIKTRFFTDISHEFRTPLSLMSGPLDKLINEAPQSENSSEWLDMIQRNSKRLLQLVNQLLDISRLDSGHMKLVLEDSDIIKLIRVLANEYHSLAEKNHICYILDIPEEKLSIWNDRDKISKIVTNLLSNAFKFTPEFGTVTCRVKFLPGSSISRAEQLRIIVADTGPGIHPKEHGKIFDRFYRGDGEQSDMAGGTGIGLSLTREMIRLMHGEIKVKSMLGTGTIFMVTLPLGIEHLKENEYIIRDPAKQISQDNDPKKRAKETNIGDDNTSREQLILIVEDNDELRTFIRENLESSFRTMEAEDGLEGWKAATSAIPELIITDIMMPGMDGNKLCEKLKKDERTSHIPLIMLTARATTHDRIEGLEYGADDDIFKPFSMEEVEARIDNLLEQRERLRKKYSEYIGLDWNEITVSTPDEQFLKRVTDFISQHLHEFTFDVRALQGLMAMSGSTLYKKLKALTGETPASLIRIMRLKLAASMLKKNERSITDILMSVGFSNPSCFTRCFKAYYGMTPGEYQKSFNK
jgi:signal transduction histidine kinase/DNA-binding response OmpR family regulator